MEDDKCTCDEGHEEHLCPYQEDVNDMEVWCNCCPSCTQKCLDDI